MKKYVKKQIKEAAKVYAPIFVQNKWTWFKVGGSTIPTEQDIKNQLIEFYKRLKKSDSHTIASGRLVVSKDGEKEFHFYLEA